MATTGIHIRHPTAMGIVEPVFSCAVICAPLCMRISRSLPGQEAECITRPCIERGVVM